MVDVVKRNGNKELFDTDKIRKSIKKAFVDAGVSVTQNKEKIENIIRCITKMTKDKTEITARTIREKVLEGLDKTKEVASDAWRKFDKKYKPK